MNQQFVQPKQQMPYFGEAQGMATNNASMQEKDMMLDLLSSAKALADGYCIQTQEASCVQLRHMMMENWSQTMNDQYTIFDAMRTRGWYEVKEAPAQEIQQAKQTFTQEKQQMQAN